MKTVRYRKIQSGIYQLAAPFSIQTDIIPDEAWASEPYLMLTRQGMLFLEIGYVSDGPSGPTLDSPCSIRGAFIHDAFYRLMRRGKLSQDWRKRADEIIRECCLEDGMWAWRAGIWYHSLRVAGAGSAKYDSEDGAILIAP